MLSPWRDLVPPVGVDPHDLPVIVGAGSDGSRSRTVGTVTVSVAPAAAGTVSPSSNVVPAGVSRVGVEALGRAEQLERRVDPAAALSAALI